MVNNNENEKNELAGLIHSIQLVRQKIVERDNDFKSGKKEFENLKSAKNLEPHLKVQGGPTYKKPNYQKQMKETLLNIRDKQQKHNHDISKAIETEFKKRVYDMPLKALEKHAVQELVDEGIKSHNSRNNDNISTDREASKYLYQNGVNPKEMRGKDKPLDKDLPKEIPKADKTLQERVKDRSVEMKLNKKDIGLDR